MSGAKYNYDENSETWPFFAMTIIGVLVVPSTVVNLYSIFFPEKSNEAGHVDTDFKAKNHKKLTKVAAKKRMSKVFNLKNMILLIGWIVLYVLYLHVSTKEVAPAKAIFDPFEILSISASATEKEIKSVYRKLSIKFHPDKLSPSLSEEAKAKAEEAFVLINKAYKALTDVTTKENYEKYGHPDGPQAVTQGIALPKFLIEAQGNYVVIAYLLLIGIFLPIFVTRWWHSAKSFTKKGLRTETANTFVEKLLVYKATIFPDTKLVFDWIFEAQELKDEFPNLTKEQAFKHVKDYCNRVVGDKHEDERLLFISMLPELLYGLIDIVSYFRQNEILLSAVDALKCIMQAVPISKNLNKQQLLQLPNIDRKSVLDSDIRTLGKLLKLTREEQKKALGIKDDAKLNQTLKVAEQIPILKVVSARFKVPGEDFVPPKSIAHIEVKVLVKSAKQHGVVPIELVKKMVTEKSEESLEDMKDPFKSIRDQPRLPSSYTPFFPGSKKMSWLSVFCVQQDGKVAEQPEFINHLDLSNLKISNENFNKSLKDNGNGLVFGTIKIPLSQPTPEKEGIYHFRLLLKSTDYFGCDLDIPIAAQIKVKKTAKVSEVTEKEAMELEEEINDDVYFDSEDEDEIAEANGIILDDEDDDDDDYDWSDIDTDTDDED